MPLPLRYLPYRKTLPLAAMTALRILLVTAIMTAFQDVVGASDTYRSLRSLGMGGAATAVVDDVDSLFINPAGLGRVNSVQWLIGDVHAGLNGLDGIEAFQGLNNDNFAEKLSKLYGKPVWAGVGAKTAFTIPYFSMAAYDSLDVELSLHNPAYSTIEARATNDFGIALGFAFPVLPEIAYSGFSFKRIWRRGFDEDIQVDTLGNLDEDELKEFYNRKGTAYAFDFGFVASIPGPISPSFGVAWKNIGVTSFKLQDPNKEIPDIAQNLTVGVSATLDTPIISITPALDFSNITDSEMQLAKKIHLGVEFDLPVFDFRAGLNQGYYTLGAGADFSIVRVDAVTYGVELGEYPGQFEDRRYLLQLSVKLELDPSLGIFGGEAKKGTRRRVKVRR